MITAKEAKSMTEKANLEIKNKCKLIAERDILPEIEKAIIKASSEGKSLTNYSLKKSDISSIEIHLIINTIIAELEKAGYCTHTTNYCKDIVINIDWNER